MPSTRLIRAALSVAAALSWPPRPLNYATSAKRLHALGPATRAAVVAELSADEVKKVRGR